MGPVGETEERISLAGFVHCPQDTSLYPSCQKLSYPPLPAALPSPPRGCPSLAPKVASSLLPCCCRIWERSHRICQQTGMQPCASQPQEQYLEAKTWRGVSGGQGALGGKGRPRWAQGTLPGWPRGNQSRLNRRLCPGPPPPCWVPSSERLWGPCHVFTGGFLLLLLDWLWERTWRSCWGGGCEWRVGILYALGSSWSSCDIPGRSDPGELRDLGRRSLIIIIYYFLSNGGYETWDFISGTTGNI